MTVGAVNDVPVAMDDSGATGKSTPVTIDLLANDSDPDGDSLSLASVGQGANGSVADNGLLCRVPFDLSTGADSDIA